MFERLNAADVESGIARIEAIVAQFDAATLARAGAHEAAQKAATQPWLVAGVSDGMGLHTVVAAIASGALRTGLGVYWEPPHFLERDESGAPVSPVHWARVQNAAALQEWARRQGAEFRVIAADVIMAPERDLKGNAKGAPNPFPDEIRAAFEEVRGRTANKDAVVINSVAFGKWISPREGVDAIAVPTVDFEGRIIEMRTKKFHARGYQETLDTMGRNHGLLLEAVRELGWLGADALTAFFTWAGGSQNVDVLQGIYGKGALGDAKVIAESDIAAFRLKWGLELGAHAIVRLPAFLSAALMGIPGGGLFGLISRAYLEERRLFEDMPRLAERMIDRMFGPQWVRENPISQIELDHAETLHIEAISARVDEAHRRVEAHWSAHPDSRAEPIELAQSRELLAGLAGIGGGVRRSRRRKGVRALPRRLATRRRAVAVPGRRRRGGAAVLRTSVAGRADREPGRGVLRHVRGHGLPARVAGRAPRARATGASAGTAGSRLIKPFSEQDNGTSSCNKRLRSYRPPRLPRSRRTRPAGLDLRRGRRGSSR